MTYKDFLDILEKNKLELEDVAKDLGYNKNSIANNWSKDVALPQKVTITIKLYLEVSKLKKENEQLKNQLFEGNEQFKNINTNLNKEALKIALKKCKDHNISLEQYLSSLVISHI